MLDLHNINSPNVSTEDTYDIVPNPDGSLTRPNEMPTLPATPEIHNPDNSTGLVALSKDITLNPANNTFIRLFRPVHHPPNAKLPFIIYFHGGGFVFCSVASSVFHESCNHIAAHFPALIASVEYRRPPEHRLPAAYDDAIDALLWAKAQALSGESSNPWIKELANFSRVFLMGSSAGGNMVYHVGLRALDLDLHPIKIVGLIMNQPFFGGVRRTGSELKYIHDHVLPLHGADKMWSLALPEGADRGHEYCDPCAGGGPDEEKIRRLPAMVVRGYTGDPLVDREEEFVKMLEARGGHVIPQFFDGGHHGTELSSELSKAVYDDFKDFVCSVSGVDQAK